MSGSSKVGGGINPMHLTNDKNGFGSARGMKGTSKFATSQATGATAASRPGFRSANAAMKSKKA